MVDDEEGVMRFFQLEGAKGRIRKRWSYYHNERVLGRMFSESVGQCQDAGKIGRAGQQCHPGQLGSGPGRLPNIRRHDEN